MSAAKQKREPIKPLVLGLAELQSGQQLTVEQIADLIGRTRKGIASTIASLVQEGIMVKERMEGRSWLYCLATESPQPSIRDLVHRLWRPTCIPAELSFHD